MADLLLGIDVGTSSVKGALFDRTGGVHGAASATLTTRYPHPGWAEQSPADWWSAIARVTRDLLHDGAAERIAGIGLCAQMCGMVAVDAAGDPLADAPIWLDTRSRDEARALMRGWPRVSGYGAWPLLRWLRVTNGAPNLAGRDPISKYLWLRGHEPGLYRDSHRLLDVKDYLLARLCDRFVTTPDCAHLTWLYDSRRREWSADLLAATGIERERLPDVVGSTTRVAGLSARAAGELGLPPGLPVAAGAGDLVACGLGSGSYGDGTTHLSIGTSSWLAAFVDRRKVDVFSGIGTVCGPGDDDYLLVATQETAGACVDWGCRMLGLGPEDSPDRAAFDALAEQSPPGARGVVFRPWLQGERVPIDDHAVRGGFANLALSTTPADLARAILEGVALNIRWALERFTRLHREGPQALRLVGGAGHSRPWCQVIADVLQRPLQVVERPELAGARGAAVTAACALGWIDDLEASRELVVVARTHDPDPHLAPLYANRLAALKLGYRANRGWQRRYAPGTDGGDDTPS